MANNPKKVKDPTEDALSAIQDALNMSEPRKDADRNMEVRFSDPAPEPVAEQRSFEPRRDERAFEPDPQVYQPRAANDDRETIGQILQALQRSRPGRSAYTIATFFVGVWILGCGLLTISFLPSLQAFAGQGSGGVLALAGLGALFLAPILLVYLLAALAWRGQELNLIAQSMAQVAIRFSEPEGSAFDSMVTVGQAIRREVAAMGDGVERAIARATELETLVTNEVSALERAYSDNEVRIRALLQDISQQRDNLVGQAEQVRNAISGVQIDLRHDIALISDAIASRVDEVAQSITSALEERGAHITGALGTAGDNMILALGERGGDLLDRLEEASSENARAVLDASERLTANLNFKTGSVHEEFVDLADRVHDMLTERIDSVTVTFEKRAADLIDSIADRSEQVQDSMKNSTDSLLLELELRSGDLVSKVDDAGSRMADRILSSGDKARNSLDTTVNELLERVVSHTEIAHDALSNQMSSFEELMKDQGLDLAERFSRDSSTLGALITRHVSEFDRTVKTFGGEIVERMGQRTQTISDSLKDYVDTFDSRVASNGGEITAALDQRLVQFESQLASRVTNLDVSLDTRIRAFDEAVVGRVSALEESFDTRTRSVTETLDSRLSSIAISLTDGASSAVSMITQRVDGIAQTIDDRTNHLTETVNARFQEVQQGLDSRSISIIGEIETRVAQFEDLLGSRVEAVAGRIESSGREASDSLVARAQELSLSIRSNAGEAERTLTNTANQIRTLSSDMERTLNSAAAGASDQIRSFVSDVERSVTTAGTTAAAAMLTSAREAEAAINNSSAAAENKMKLISTEIERAVVTSAGGFGSTMTEKSTEIVNLVGQQTDRLVQLIDDKRGLLVDAISGRGNQITTDISRVTDEALASIEGKGLVFTQSVSVQATDIARMINTASETATSSIGKSMRDIEQTTRSAIDQSRQVATAAVTEMQETSKILRTDTVALFERLREGNILLQEVLSGSHDNLNSLEKALVSRVADFVTTMNDVTGRHGASTGALEGKLKQFTETTGKALKDLGALSDQFDAHGRALVDAAALVERSNVTTSDSVAGRQAALESLVTTIDLRTADLDDRLTRFTGLLDESLAAAESRARDIARIVAETAGAGSSSITRQFEAVRASAEEERRLTSEAMTDIYQQGMQEADAMFKQSADRFTQVVQGVKEMASEMQQELETTRAELRRGVLEIPQEASEGTAQMRKVIVDQIEALAELNRIVARHGRGMDVVATATRSSSSYREEEQMMATASARSQEAPVRQAPPMPRSSANLPPPDFGTPVPSGRRTEAPPMSPANDQSRDGWLSDLLNRADTDREPQRAQPAPQAPANPLEALSLDIMRLMDRNMASDMWDRYQRGDRKAFSKRLYTPNGQKAFDEVNRKYRGDRAFKQATDRYITEFERVLDEVSRDERGGPAALRNYLASETGLVYTLLAHAAGRLA